MIKLMADKQSEFVKQTKVVIIGGGLSGLYAAYLLEQQGIYDYVLLEARDRLGGRIESLTVQTDSGHEHFDLGPTWYWPDYQPQLAALIDKLGLASFAQYEQGKTLVEQSANQIPNAVNGYVNVPTSMRIKGGVSELINAIFSTLNKNNICLNSKVNSVALGKKNGVDVAEVSYQNSYQNSAMVSHQRIAAEHVLLALPPQLAIANIEFTPALPTALTTQWQTTPTWMAAHAKYVAVYEQPFWRSSGGFLAQREAVLALWWKFMMPQPIYQLKLITQVAKLRSLVLSVCQQMFVNPSIKMS